MTPEEKIDYLRAQIQAAEGGLTKIIQCPYCQSSLDFSPPSALDDNWKPPVCCETFALAAIAVLKMHEQREMKDLADRIRANIGGVAVFN